MRRSSKPVFYAVISNPLQVSALIGSLVGVIAYAVTRNLLVYFLLLLYLIPFCVLERTIPRGHPRILSRQLTPLFYALRGPSGRFCVVMRRPPDKVECRELMHLVAAQSRLLPEALTASPGKYRAITHETVLRRIEAVPGAVIESAKPVYTADMSATLDALAKGRCRKCTGSCPFAVGRQVKRQFYAVMFTIC